MAINPKKNKVMKSFWFKDEKEYRKLIDALEGNFQEEVLNIMFEIYNRGDAE